MEEYRNVYENYEISNLGNCRKLLYSGKYKQIKGSILKTGGGYRYFQQHRKGKRKNILFHRLVAQAFLEPVEGKPFVDHIDRNPMNNNLTNLRYVTHKENLRNTDRYHADIKAEGKERVNIIEGNRRKKFREAKTHTCTTCPLVVDVRGGGIYGDKRQYTEHMKSELHLKRIKVIDEMTKLNIDINHTTYKKYRLQLSDKKKSSDIIKCECGVTLQKISMIRHLKTKKHINFYKINNL